MDIGTDKAGSSTIQKFIGAQPDPGFGLRQIEAFGLSNAWKLAHCVGKPGRNTPLVAREMRLPATFQTEEVPRMWADARREIEATDSTRFVCSSEYFYARALSRADLRELRERLLELFDRIVIIVYLREQVSYLKSLYFQNVKGSTRLTAGYDRFIREMDSYRENWDYHDSVGRWIEVFGHADVRVVPFRRDFWEGGSLLHDFCHRIEATGITLPDAAASARANPSKTFGQVQVMRRLNLLPWSRKNPLRRKVQGLLFARLPQSFLGQDFPSTHDARIVDKVSDSNRALAALLGVDFRGYLPTQPVTPARP